MSDGWIKDNLTPKQLEYICLMASGFSTLEVAEEKFVSHHTVRNTIAKAKDRIGASSTTNLIATAVANGWIEKNGYTRPYTFEVVENA